MSELNNEPPIYNNHTPIKVDYRTKEILEISKVCLNGILSGPYSSIALVNAMQSSQRTTLGNILINEAWDMAECLMEKYESKLSET